MTDHSVAESEMVKLEAIASRRNLLFAVAQIAVLLALGAGASRRLLGEGYRAFPVILAVGLMVGVIGVLIYL